MRVWGGAGEGEAKRWRGEEGEGACSCSLREVRRGYYVDLGKGQLTCLVDARQFRGCVGLDSGTDVPREGLLTRAMDQSQSLCREYLKVKGSEVEWTFGRVDSRSLSYALFALCIVYLLLACNHGMSGIPTCIGCRPAASTKICM